MTIQETDHGQYVTLAPAGDLDANSSLRMDEHITQVLSRGQSNIHIDCSGLNYISSAGLGVFISFLDEIQLQGGKLVFSGLSEHVFKVFSLLGLHQIMTIKGTAAEAEKEFSI